MASGLPDLVDCARLASEEAVLERAYDLAELPRLRDLLVEPSGSVRARFVFAKLDAGRCGAKVSVHAIPQLVCQRCMQGFGLPVEGDSEVEFTPDEAQVSETEREFYKMDKGLISLRELAEEELLLALPVAPKCDEPLTCGKAPSYVSGDAKDDVDEVRRPFSSLQDLLKKT
jgi:uncharacterized protein